MKILIVVGARPNFMKAAPILNATRQFNAIRGEWVESLQQSRSCFTSNEFFACPIEEIRNPWNDPGENTLNPK